MHDANDGCANDARPVPRPVDERGLLRGAVRNTFGTSFVGSPQLYNILRGEMSFVGPRPEMPFVVERYDDTQLQRLTVKPGLTGLWQISADRAFKIHDNMHYDLYYVDHRSPVMDLAICILTPFMLLPRGRGK